MYLFSKSGSQFSRSKIFLIENWSDILCKYETSLTVHFVREYFISNEAHQA